MNDFEEIQLSEQASSQAQAMAGGLIQSIIAFIKAKWPVILKQIKGAVKILAPIFFNLVIQIIQILLPLIISSMMTKFGKMPVSDLVSLITNHMKESNESMDETFLTFSKDYKPELESK